MEHAIALAYLISCLLLAASFPIVLIRKNQNGTEDVFFAHIQGFLLLLLLALLFNMMLHYYQTVFAPAQRDTPLMLCNLLCDLCVFFWIEMQRCVVTSRLGSMVRKLCRLYLITYLSVWILANTPQLPDKIVLWYLELLLLLFLLLHVTASGFEQLRGKSADQLFFAVQHRGQPAAARRLRELYVSSPRSDPAHAPDHLVLGADRRPDLRTEPV